MIRLMLYLLKYCSSVFVFRNGKVDSNKILITNPSSILGLWEVKFLDTLLYQFL